MDNFADMGPKSLKILVLMEGTEREREREGRGGGGERGRET